MSPQAADRAKHEGAHQRSSLLRMNMAGQALAVPIEDVREILEASRWTPVPHTPDFVRGVMNLRGAVVPVIDLAVRLGHAPTVLGRRSCIVVVECEVPADNDDDAPGVLVMGLLVDAVYEVFDAEGAGIEPVPPLGTTVEARFLAGMARVRGQVLPVVALPQVLQHRELAAAVAAHGRSDASVALTH